MCRAEGFTLHGLWPNLDNPCPADYPEHCDDSVFNRNEIEEDVLQSMERVWPSYSTCEPFSTSGAHVQSLFDSISISIPKVCLGQKGCDIQFHKGRSTASLLPAAQAARSWHQLLPHKSVK